MSNQPGILYVVATPIGNLADMTARAVEVLSRADLIAAEDTRHSAGLLQHYGVHTPVTSFHEHNERQQTPRLMAELGAGKSIALISDAGTPLVSDPGFRLVRAAHAAGFRVVPVPGACAAIAALSVSGLPPDAFCFEGFPPARAAPRRQFLEARRHETRTLIFYESPHRIVETLRDMAAVFGPEREAVIARELTKRFETVEPGTLGEFARRLEQEAERRRGEFVILVHGAAPGPAGSDTEAERVLRLLLAELPVGRAAALAAEITGRKKNALYQLALTLKAGAAPHTGEAADGS